MYENYTWWEMLRMYDMNLRWYEWMRKWVIDNAMYKSVKVHGRMVVKEWMTSNLNKTQANKMWTNTVFNVL